VLQFRLRLTSSRPPRHHPQRSPCSFSRFHKFSIEIFSVQFLLRIFSISTGLSNFLAASLTSVLLARPANHSILYAHLHSTMSTQPPKVKHTFEHGYFMSRCTCTGYFMSRCTCTGLTVRGWLLAGCPTSSASAEIEISSEGVRASARARARATWRASAGEQAREVQRQAGRERSTYSDKEGDKVNCALEKERASEWVFGVLHCMHM